MNDTLTLVPGKPDKELAEEFKSRVIEAYKPFMEILDEALKAGFIVNVQCGPGPMGKVVITQLIVAKHF